MLKNEMEFDEVVKMDEFTPVETETSIEGLGH